MGEGRDGKKIRSLQRFDCAESNCDPCRGESGVMRGKGEILEHRFSMELEEGRDLPTREGGGGN